MTAAVEIEGVTVTFDDVVAVDDLTMTFEGGKIHGLLGRNGSGKSTLLSVIAAFRKPTSGVVKIDGRPVFEDPVATRKVCLVREVGDTLEASEKIQEQLRYCSLIRPGWDGDYADRLLDTFRLDPDKRIDALSRGQRSALAVTIGLASRAPVTLLDEVYLGMDAPTRYAFYDELLADFIAHPRTFVLSTHLIEEVARVFEGVTIIDEGRLLVHEESDTLRERGAALTGPADTVDRFVDELLLEVLASRQLGNTRSVTVYGRLDERQRHDAAAAGIDIEPVPLQDLFVHLTAARESRHASIV